jgi:peptide/nickel transport system ATP-binding protein
VTDVVLTATDLTIAFDTEAGHSARPVVDGISFELHRGRTLALVGESGSGKSVTAMSLLGLLPGNARVSGSIHLGADELVGASTPLLREVRGGRIGTIFQEPMNAFNPVLTIGWQIEEALKAHRSERRAAAAARPRERVVTLLESVGIPDPERVRRAYPHQLSGGQLQRAMIAMALSSNPDVLIADEPTTALDVTVQAGILELLRSVIERFGTAILLITHDMGVVADLADDVAVMRHGRIVEHAPVVELFATPQAEYTRALLEAVPTLGSLELGSPVDATGAQEPTGPAAEDAPAAEVTDLVIDYGVRRAKSRPAVDGVSLRIDAGRIVGLVGESGSGKSTIGRALAGLVSPASGVVRVAGADLARASRRELRRARASIGYVFQDPASSLNPRASIGESIAEPLRLHSSLDGPARRRRVVELLDAVQLPRDAADRFQHELSGGQRQRVAIARAIALTPALLIADEPTSALDVSVQARVLDLLRELQRGLGFACLFISHDLAVVADLVDEVAVMHEGRIVERGSVDDVLRRPADPYTQRLLAAAPVADPAAQVARREAWLELTARGPEEVAS